MESITYGWVKAMAPSSLFFNFDSQVVTEVAFLSSLEFMLEESYILL